MRHDGEAFVGVFAACTVTTLLLFVDKLQNLQQCVLARSSIKSGVLLFIPYTHPFATYTGSFLGNRTSSTPDSDSQGYCSPMLAANHTAITEQQPGIRSRAAARVGEHCCCRCLPSRLLQTKGPSSASAHYSHLMPRATDALTCVKPDSSSLPNFLKAILLLLQLRVCQSGVIYSTNRERITKHFF